MAAKRGNDWRAVIHKATSEAHKVEADETIAQALTEDIHGCKVILTYVYISAVSLQCSSYFEIQTVCVAAILSKIESV